MRIIIGFAKDYTLSRQVYFECDDYYKKNDEKITLFLVSYKYTLYASILQNPSFSMMLCNHGTAISSDQSLSRV